MSPTPADPTLAGPTLDEAACYRAVRARDRPLRRPVLDRGAHHRDLLPALLPRSHSGCDVNVTFHASAAAAQAAGFRACKRCLPDAVPGSPAGTSPPTPRGGPCA